MKKLIIFETILILFFVSAWNVSKADLDDSITKEYCISLENEMYELMNYLKLDYKGLNSEKPEQLYNMMIEDEDRLYKLSVTYENLCD
jgi:hypothetical protein